MVPKTRYARSGDVTIAYQVVGDGPFDLVLVLGAITNIEYQWEEPAYARFLSRLASFSRLIIFDKRGMGLSDRSVGIATLEERMDDVRAVMDAAPSESAALVGISEGGPMTALFAATYPERTKALVLYGSFVRGVASPDVPSARTVAQVEEDIVAAQRHWGEDGFGLAGLAPSVATDERYARWWGRLMRTSASPAAIVALERMNAQIDVSDVLPSIRVPTLVLHRTGDRLEPVEIGRYIAQRIPGARLVELAGEDHMPIIGDQDAILDEIEEFLTGVRPIRDPVRVLATVLVIEPIDPTTHALELGDRRWRDVRGQLQTLIRQALERFRGAEVVPAHARVIATFDGPARAIHCAAATHDAARSLGLQVRAGVHTGEVELRGGDAGGAAVQLAAWVMTLARPDETLASRTVKDLVAGAGIQFVDRGTHQLTRQPETWQVYAATVQHSPTKEMAAAPRHRTEHGDLSPIPRDDVTNLTRRELEVLRLLVEGHSNQEIAAELFISPHTAIRHVASIMNKLGVDSRTAAATWAVRNGLV